MALSLETKVCARPGCGKAVTSARVDARFCSRECNRAVNHKASQHKARDNQRAASRVNTCPGCGKVFQAGNKRKIRCPECDAAEQRRIQEWNLEFIGIDGEGMSRWCNAEDCTCQQYVSDSDGQSCATCGHNKEWRTDKQGHWIPGHEHVYVLLRCGNAEPLERENGIQWWEALDYLYAQFQAHPHAVFCGFFLNYDFIQLFKTLSWDRARKLLTPQGKAERKRTGKPDLPVDITAPDGKKWQLWWLENRCLSFQPTGAAKSDGLVRMYVTDAGPFFQTSFLKAISPDSRQGDSLPCSPADYELISHGKKRRSSAVLDDEMRLYNRKEIEVFSRLMTELNQGFVKMGVRLGKDVWYGPGASVAYWLDSEKVPRRDTIEKAVPAPFRTAAQQSYFGGWFEIMAHGRIPGTVYEYDINSAYPHIISQLPCLLHGRYSSGDNLGKTERMQRQLPSLPEGAIRLVYAHVKGSDPHIGVMMHRRADLRIYRPQETEGWFWQHELEAAQRAHVIDDARFYRWHTYQPCDCFPPVRHVANLYQQRLAVNKKSPMGKALKLVFNSAYGKFAQSSGSAPFGNPVYASLITAGCRAMILDAIATHPGGTSATVMVATDGVYFTSIHPGLETRVSTKLGDWECNTHENLTLFKPGVYWDDETREDIRQGREPQFKSRGINARDFSDELSGMDAKFDSWNGHYPRAEDDWPAASFPVRFSIRTCKQVLNIPTEHRDKNGKAVRFSAEQQKAIQHRNWNKAGRVIENQVRTDSSYPGEKRDTGYYDAESGIYRSHPYAGERDKYGRIEKSIPYDRSFGARAMEEKGLIDKFDSGITPDGGVDDLLYGALGTGQFA